MTSAPEWHTAKLALTLLAIDPKGLGGIWLRARSGPVRDRFSAALGDFLTGRQLKRIAPSATDDVLFGGLDLTATLDSGQAVFTPGILNETSSLLLLPMAERCETGLTARIATAMDGDPGHCLIALDEGIEDERLPVVLSDRLAFHIDLSDVSYHGFPKLEPDFNVIAVQQTFVNVSLPEDAITQVVEVAAYFGVIGPRAPLFALRVARAIAALDGATMVSAAHLTQAMQLVFAPRATIIPEDQDEDTQQTEQQSPQETDQQSKESSNRDAIPTDLIIDAITAALPRHVLDLLSKGGAAKLSGGSGMGDRKKGNRRGRPKPSRQGRIGSGARVDVIATLRAAAPWQKLRREAKLARDIAVHVRSSDIRIKQFEDRSDRLLIFVVDASGSAALARLAEAKGAVELLLAEAYARRDHVALIAFRGTQADILLPPTRSLVQTKRRLSAMAGGGGTPLAAGLQQALTLAESSRSKGLTPTIAVLTDGRANIALDGTANRAQAAQDAQTIARLIQARGTSALVIDTGARPHTALNTLAGHLDAPYLPLPRADARTVSQTIEAVLE